MRILSVGVLYHFFYCFLLLALIFISIISVVIENFTSIFRNTSENIIYFIINIIYHYYILLFLYSENIIYIFSENISIFRNFPRILLVFLLVFSETLSLFFRTNLCLVNFHHELRYLIHIYAYIYTYSLFMYIYIYIICFFFVVPSI